MTLEKLKEKATASELVLIEEVELQSRRAVIKEVCTESYKWLSKQSINPYEHKDPLGALTLKLATHLDTVFNANPS